MWSLYAARSPRCASTWASAGASPRCWRTAAAGSSCSIPAVLDARHARALLWRRDRHGGQRLSGRPRRRAHADAVVPGPQRRLFPRGPGAALPAPDHGRDLRPPGRERRGADPALHLAAAADAADPLAAQFAPGLRPRHDHLPVSAQPQGARLPPALRGRDHPLRGQPGSRLPGRRARAERAQGTRAGRSFRPLAVSRGDGAALSAHPARAQLLLVCAARAGPARRRPGRGRARGRAGVRDPGRALRLAGPEGRPDRRRPPARGAPALPGGPAVVRRQGPPDPGNPAGGGRGAARGGRGERGRLAPAAGRHGAQRRLPAALFPAAGIRVGRAQLRAAARPPAPDDRARAALSGRRRGGRRERAGALCPGRGPGDARGPRAAGRAGGRPGAVSRHGRLRRPAAAGGAPRPPGSPGSSPTPRSASPTRPC